MHLCLPPKSTTFGRGLRLNELYRAFFPWNKRLLVKALRRTKVRVKYDRIDWREIFRINNSLKFNPTMNRTFRFSFFALNLRALILSLRLIVSLLWFDFFFSYLLASNNIQSEIRFSKSYSPMLLDGFVCVEDTPMLEFSLKWQYRPRNSRDISYW